MESLRAARGQVVRLTNSKGKVSHGVLKSIDGAIATLVLYGDSFAPEEKVDLREVAVVDVEFTGLALKTDGEVSANKESKRELQRFDIGQTEQCVGLDDEKHTRWDQYALNKEKFGVESTYREEFYTTTIDKSDPQFALKDQRAKRIAQEIMSGPVRDAHMREERHNIIDSSLDEESRYSTVLDSKPKLNPAAKEFVFNPNASDFNPTSFGTL